MDATPKPKLPKRVPDVRTPDAEPEELLDAADLGTAWGLDYSFEQAEHDGLPGSHAPWRDDADD